MVAVATPDRPGHTDEASDLKSHMNLFCSIFRSFGDEANVFEGTAMGLRDTPPIWGTDGAGAPAAAAALQIEGQRSQNRFRSDRDLAPLESPERFVRAVKGDALPTDPLV